MSWFKTPQLRNISSYPQTLWQPVQCCWQGLMTCCFWLVLEKVFPSKSWKNWRLLFWGGVPWNASRVRELARWSEMKQHLDSNNTWIHQFQPTKVLLVSSLFWLKQLAGDVLFFFFSLSDCWTSVKRGFYGVSHLLSLTPSSLSFLCQRHQPLCEFFGHVISQKIESKSMCHKVFQGPSMTLTNDKGRVWIPFFSVT